MALIRYLTYNLQYEGGSPFAFFSGRGDYAAKYLSGLDADVIGFQEVTDRMRDFLREKLPAYIFVGNGREADFTGESMLVGYRRDRFELLSLDTFWLSDTPRIPGSVFHSDQSACPRICTVLELMHRESLRRFRVYNIHLDHEGEMARCQGLSLVLERIAGDYAKDPLPVILSGDFNDVPDSPVMRSVTAFKGAGSDFRDITRDVGITYHEYTPYDPAVTVKIDYVFTNAPADCSRSRTLKDHTEDGMYLSDHYPILTEIDV